MVTGVLSSTSKENEPPKTVFSFIQNHIYDILRPYIRVNSYAILVMYSRFYRGKNLEHVMARKLLA